MKKEHSMEYEVYWQGADGNWRTAAIRKRSDHLLAYLREFIERYPDVPVVAYKVWTIRHAVFEMRTGKLPEKFPEITLNKQLNLYERNREEDSTVPVANEHASEQGLRGNGGSTEGSDHQLPGETGCGDVDSQEPARL